MTWIAMKMLIGDRAKNFGVLFGVTLDVTNPQLVVMSLIQALVGGRTRS